MKTPFSPFPGSMESAWTTYLILYINSYFSQQAGLVEEQKERDLDPRFVICFTVQRVDQIIRCQTSPLQAQAHPL